MAKISYRASYYLLYVLFAIIAVVLVLFFGVGFNNPNAAGLNEPQYTDALIYLKYAFAAATAILAVLAGIIQFGQSLKDDPKGAVKTVIALVLVVALVVVCYSIGSDAPIMANGEAYTDAFWLKITDMFLYSMYALAALATLATIVNLTGIFKK